MRSVGSFCYRSGMDSPHLPSFKGVKATFQIRQTGEITLIDIVGRLTLGDPVTGLRDALSKGYANGRGKVILNLGGLEYMDSAGLGELIFVNKRSPLKLLNVPKRVEDLLRLTGSYALFDVQPDEQTAISSFL